MPVTNTSPAPGASFTCDACNVSRVWGAWDKNTGAIVCTVCLTKGVISHTGATIVRGQRREDGGWVRPSDATGTPTKDALKLIQDA